MKKSVPSNADSIADRILSLRGQKVILDSDLAALYGVQTGALNRAVKRNAKRFPADFAFRLKAEEKEALKCHFGISKRRGGRRYPPQVFTEHGAVMAANVLNSDRAVEMSVFVVRVSIPGTAYSIGRRRERPVSGAKGEG